MRENNDLRKGDKQKNRARELTKVTYRVGGRYAGFYFQSG